MDFVCYENVFDLCVLRFDLEIFFVGDFIEIGEWVCFFVFF